MHHCSVSSKCRNEVIWSNVWYEFRNERLRVGIKNTAVITRATFEISSWIIVKEQLLERISLFFSYLLHFAFSFIFFWLARREQRRVKVDSRFRNRIEYANVTVTSASDSTSSLSFLFITGESYLSSRSYLIIALMSATVSGRADVFNLFLSRG